MKINLLAVTLLCATGWALGAAGRNLTGLGTLTVSRCADFDSDYACVVHNWPLIEDKEATYQHQGLAAVLMKTDGFCPSRLCRALALQLQAKGQCLHPFYPKDLLVRSTADLDQMIVEKSLVQGAHGDMSVTAIAVLWGVRLPGMFSADYTVMAATGVKEAMQVNYVPRPTTFKRVDASTQTYTLQLPDDVESPVVTWTPS